MKKKLYFFYTLIVTSIFFYSFTQVDLGLALTRFPLLFSIQRGFQWVGYFNRPLSAYLYGAIVLLMFGCYIAFLYQAHKKQLSRQTAWKLFFVTAGILVFSYNAFSYDLFNYIFDAKIFTYYGLSPYQHKALDFPGDPMLGFMHWTHRIYPYGPVWLGLTIPLSYVGLQFFLPTFFLFKLLAAGSYLGTTYFIGKIAKEIKPNQEIFSIVFFALNPLVIIESVVSAHLDIVMMFFAIASTYLLLEKKYVWAVIVFALSIGLKFATIFFLPVFLVIMTLQIIKNKIPWDYVLITGIFCMLLSVLAASQTSGNFQPWYLLTVLPFAALVAKRYYVFLPSVVISIAGLVYYIPYLYVGNWDEPVQNILFWLYVSMISISIVVSAFYFFVFKKKHV